MLKKLFGPKKHDAQGSPVSTEELREAMKTFFPQEGEVNKYLTFEIDEDVHDGFSAVWEYFMVDTDEDGYRGKYHLKFRVLVDIRTDERAVYFSTKRFAHSKRPPRGTEVLKPWYVGIGIGDPDAIKGEYSKVFKSFNPRKKLALLVEKATSLGWDAYM